MFETAKPTIVAVGLKVLGALALYIVGRWLIGLAGTLIQKALDRQKVEPTVVRYVGNVINVALNILLVIGILGYFGVETTSFAALIAAAWHRDRCRLGRAACPISPPACSSSCFGRSRSATTCLRADVEGTVRAIGLFSTTIDTPGQCADVRRQRQGDERHDQEFLEQSVPSSRSVGAARSQRRPGGRRCAG